MLDEKFRIQIAGAELWYVPNFLDTQQANVFYQQAKRDIAWRSDSIRLFGKSHLIPRLHAFYGDKGLSYRYSGIVNHALPWTNPLLEIRAELENRTQSSFNALLANFYRDGNDRNGWHADNEPELGPMPVIASLSFGAGRDFQLRRNSDRKRVDIHLEPGSLLLMAGATQRNWQHCIPKRKRCQNGRINLTFRKVMQEKVADSNA